MERLGPHGHGRVSVAELEGLVAAAAEVVSPTRIGDHVDVGGVGAALLTVDGNVYVGVSIDTACSMGMCAEVAAAAQMLTSGEIGVAAMVAVGVDGAVMAPCGKCREFISQLGCDPVVVLPGAATAPLSDLLPCDWKSVANGG